MRDIGTLATHVQSTTTTLAVCWHMTTKTGQVLAFTSCSRDLTIDGVTYLANQGIEPTAVEVNIGLAVNNSEMSGFLTPDGIQGDLVEAGFYDGAVVKKFLVNYEDPEGDQIRLIWGVLGEVQLRGDTMYQAEIRGGSQWLAATILPLTQATCRAVFGDPIQCKADKRSNTGTVTAVASRKEFTASGLVGARADGFFDYGYLQWTSGPSNGLRYDVRHYNQATGTITLMEELVLTIGAGNTFTIYEGCNKTRAACKTKKRTSDGGTNNIANFDGEPDIPGNDVMLHITRAN